jgi:DNA-binding GntR family transcriptional regulator
MSRDRIVSFTNEDIYTQLKEHILSRVLRPSERLQPSQLAEHFGASVTPVREALIKLASESLVTFKSGRGFFSKEIDAQEQLDLYEVRFALLKYCIEGHPPEKKTIIAGPRRINFSSPDTHGSIVDARVLANVAAIEEFYAGLARLSHNPMIIDLVRNLNERTRVSRIITHESSADSLNIFTAMADVAQSLQSGETNSAIRAMQKRFRTLKPRLPELIDQRLRRMCDGLLLRPPIA